MNKKFVPYNKMSKRQRKEYNKLKRLSWGLVKPATQTHKDRTDYNRQQDKLRVKKEADTLT